MAQATIYLLLIETGSRFEVREIKSSVVAQTVKRLSAMWETWVRSLGWEIPPREGSGNRLQCSCLENPMDRGTIWGCKELDTTEQLTLSFSCQ